MLILVYRKIQIEEKSFPEKKTDICCLCKVLGKTSLPLIVAIHSATMFDSLRSDKDSDKANEISQPFSRGASVLRRLLKKPAVALKRHR